MFESSDSDHLIDIWKFHVVDHSQMIPHKFRRRTIWRTATKVLLGQFADGLYETFGDPDRRAVVWQKGRIHPPWIVLVYAGRSVPLNIDEAYGHISFFRRKN